MAFNGAPCELGIDEAGRGPVLGSMVYGSAYCPLSYHETLKSIGFADSKQLKEEEREQLFSSIKENKDNIGYHVRVITPEELSAKMLRKSKYNLNAISHDAAIELIQRALDEGVNVKEVYVDTVGDPSKYEQKLSALFPNIKIKVSAKADSLFPIVSAASICAKVTRDTHLKEFKFRENGITIAAVTCSGYPSDGNTKTWLSEHLDPVFGFPSIVRFSWATCVEMLKKRGVPIEWEEDDEQDDGADIRSMFDNTAKNKHKRCRFFTERGLELVTKF
eukprot:GILJ01008510.1.p1 GENE.GILJ01008510.1~~GILJ01008510.1.p1  ORF type:complete len:276 (+),score=39.07 GILJ01008510.1:39-866(+)